MVSKALQRGTQYYDRKHGTISHVLQRGFVSGKTLVVATNRATGLVRTAFARQRAFNPTTLLRGSRRYVPIND